MPSPDHTPEIPDSVSFAQLHQYLADKPHFPVSAVIPELNLGGPDGGICDLQFAIMQLIQRSTDGCNVLQLLSASIHLLVEIELHFAEQIRRAEAELPPFDRATSKDRAEIISILRGIIMTLRTSSGVTEELFSSLSYGFGMRRMQVLRGSVKDAPTSSEFRSHLLVSDELLNCLQLDRDPVTRYFDRAAQSL